MRKFYLQWLIVFCFLEHSIDFDWLNNVSRFLLEILRKLHKILKAEFQIKHRKIWKVWFPNMFLHWYFWKPIFLQNYASIAKILPNFANCCQCYDFVYCQLFNNLMTDWTIIRIIEMHRLENDPLCEFFQTNDLVERFTRSRKR